MRKKSTSIESSKLVSPLFTLLVLEGGGIKGQTYLSVIEALDELGMLENIEAIAGASAGAIAALMISTGWPIKKIRERFNKLDFSALVQKKGFFNRIKGFFYSFRRIINKFGLYSPKNFHTFFQETIKEATTVKGTDGKILKDGNPNMTFEEWHHLKEAHPELHLKDVFVEACNLNTGLNETFSYLSEHKDVPIADAVCASMAFPFYFTPWEIKKDKYADGGEQNNCPCNVFENPPGKFNPKVLTIRLDDLDEIRYFKYNTPPPRKKISSFLKYIIAHMKAILNAQNRLFYNSPYCKKTIFCDTLGVSTLDFDLSQQKKDALEASGYYAVMRYMHKHHPNIAERTYNPTILKKIKEAGYPLSFTAFLSENIDPNKLNRSTSIPRGSDEVDGASIKKAPDLEKWQQLHYMQEKCKDFSLKDYRKYEFSSDEVGSSTSHKQTVTPFYNHKKAPQCQKTGQRSHCDKRDEQRHRMTLRKRRGPLATLSSQVS